MQRETEIRTQIQRRAEPEPDTQRGGQERESQSHHWSLNHISTKLMELRGRGCGHRGLSHFVPKPLPPLGHPP